ncbi:hypothetical protein I4U23_001895 [Adineta vaga]|nr:hypothetical protein I4U23_001895 [Adineta vaga]
MYYIVPLFVLIYQTALALVYDDQCTNSCDIPGMICTTGRCKCDSKQYLFWTGARCAPCPNDWVMTDTACIALYRTLASWQVAKATCKAARGELISFRDPKIIPLIYETMNRDLTSDPALRIWTSAHSVDPYESKTITGYDYAYDEPTRFTNLGELEACTAAWRGQTTTAEIVCLDDRVCSSNFAFICEKSESTAQEYLGPARMSALLHIYLSLLACCLIYWFKYRKTTTMTSQNITNPKQSIQSDDVRSEVIVNEVPASKTIPIKQQKNKRAGYSKQQFDEFD